MKNHFMVYALTDEMNDDNHDKRELTDEKKKKRKALYLYPVFRDGFHYFGFGTNDYVSQSVQVMHI